MTTPTQSQIRDALNGLERICSYEVWHKAPDLQEQIFWWFKGNANTIRTILQSVLDTQKPAGDAVCNCTCKHSDPKFHAKHCPVKKKSALTGDCGGGDRPDCEEMAHAAACLLLPNNGVSDTVWYRHSMTLYEFLASYSGKELTGVVEDDYEILTGEKYPAAALTADNAKRGSDYE